MKRRKKLLTLPKKQRDKIYISFSFLHGFEILILLFILGKFLSIYFYFILIGVAFHLFLDIAYGILVIGRIDRVSLVYDFIKYKKLEFLENNFK